MVMKKMGRENRKKNPDQHQAEEVAELVQGREHRQALRDPAHVGEQVRGQQRAGHGRELLAVHQ